MTTVPTNSVSAIHLLSIESTKVALTGHRGKPFATESFVNFFPTSNRLHSHTFPFQKWSEIKTMVP